jgi:hypothetical protein
MADELADDPSEHSGSTFTVKLPELRSLARTTLR